MDFSIFTLDQTDWLVLSAIFLVPFGGYGVETGVVNLSITNIAIMLATISIFLRHSRSGTVKLSHSQLGVLSIYSVVILFSSLSTMINNGWPRFLVTQFGYLILMGVVMIYIDSQRKLRLVFWIVFLSAIVVSIFGIVNALTPVSTGGPFHPRRTVAGFRFPFRRTVGVPISYGSIGMTTLSAIAYYILYSFKKQKLFVLTGIIIVLFNVIFILQSRSTWLAMMALFATIFFFNPFSAQFGVYPRFIYNSLRVGTVVIFPWIGIFLFDLLAKIPNGLSGYTLRISQYQTSLRLMIHNPLGVGFGSLRPYFQHNAIPHNIFFRYGLGGGWIVVMGISLIILSIPLLLLKRILDGQENTQIIPFALLSGFTAVLVEGVFLTGFGKAGWLWITIAVSYLSQE